LIVVSDTGPLIHLSLVRSLDLLRELYGRILIPDLVYDEVVKAGEGLAGSAEVAKAADWIEMVGHNPESDLFRLLRTHLDAGEAAAPSRILVRNSRIPVGASRIPGARRRISSAHPRLPIGHAPIPDRSS
jgi:predicted nucleic acid-binding protein